VGSVTETSAGSAPTASVAGSPYSILVSNPVAAVGSAFKVSNYNIRYVNGLLTVIPPPPVNDFDSLLMQAVVARGHWPTRYSGSITNGWVYYVYLPTDSTGDSATNIADNRLADSTVDRPVSIFERENRIHWKVGERIPLKVVMHDMQVELKEISPAAPQKPMPVQSLPVHDSTISLSADMLFDFDQSVLKPAGKEAIAKILKDTIYGGGLEKVRLIRIDGHTDAIGSNVYNDALSLKRADAVRDYLISLGVPTKKIRAIGHGKREPIDSNDTPAGRSVNRRADITIVPNLD